MVPLPADCVPSVTSLELAPSAFPEPSAPGMPSFGVDCTTDQIGTLLLQIEDSSNFISKKLLPICDSSGVPKDKVAVSLCAAAASLPRWSPRFVCLPLRKARQGLVILAACQLYVFMFKHPST